MSDHKIFRLQSYAVTLISIAAILFGTSVTISDALLKIIILVVASILVIVALMLYKKAIKLIKEKEDEEREQRGAEIQQRNDIADIVLFIKAYRQGLRRTIRPSGIKSEEAFGNVNIKQTIQPSSIKSSEEFGETKVVLLEDEANTNHD